MSNDNTDSISYSEPPMHGLKN